MLATKMVCICSGKTINSAIYSGRDSQEILKALRYKVRNLSHHFNQVAKQPWMLWNCCLKLSCVDMYRFTWTDLCQSYYNEKTAKKF